MALVVKRVLVWAIKSCTYENGPFYAENIQKLNFVTFFNEKQQSFICKLLFPNCWTQNIKRTKTNFYSSKFMLCIDDPRAELCKMKQTCGKIVTFYWKAISLVTKKKIVDLVQFGPYLNAISCAESILIVPSSLQISTYETFWQSQEIGCTLLC